MPTYDELMDALEGAFLGQDFNLKERSDGWNISWEDGVAAGKVLEYLWDLWGNIFALNRTYSPEFIKEVLDHILDKRQITLKRKKLTPPEIDDLTITIVRHPEYGNAVKPSDLYADGTPLHEAVLNLAWASDRGRIGR